VAKQGRLLAKIMGATGFLGNAIGADDLQAEKEPARPARELTRPTSGKPQPLLVGGFAGSALTLNHAETMSLDGTQAAAAYGAQLELTEACSA